MEFLTENKLPVGKWAKAGVDWLIDHGGWAFDLLSAWLKAMIDALHWCLAAPHPLIAIAAATGLAWWLRRSLSLPLFTLLALLLILNLGYWDQMIQTLALVIAATAVCMIVGVPVGILAAHNPRFSATLRPVLDLMQTVPTFAYLIPALILFGLGMVPGLVATVIFAFPAPVRLTELGIRSTPRQLVEAGQAFGATRWQLLTRIELPNALPQIMVGLTQTIMLSLSMVVIAALVGAPGLGVPVVRALNTVNIGMGFEAGLVIVLVAILLDRFLRSGEGGEGDK
ncbi:MAG: choline ABC transporter permease subunit [Nitratireductor sp.]|nr:choline ABC transporter permease subunit [Nitratireductor sp.]MCB1460176.1 choline ABC transporter permease subunit [Nitratireductor sp.]